MHCFRIVRTNTSIEYINVCHLNFQTQANFSSEEQALSRVNEINSRECILCSLECLCRFKVDKCIHAQLRFTTTKPNVKSSCMYC